MLPRFPLARPQICLITQVNRVISRMLQFQLFKSIGPWHLKTYILQVLLPPFNGVQSSPSLDIIMFIHFALLRRGRSALSNLEEVRNLMSEAMDSGFTKPYQLFTINQNDQFFTIPLSSAL